MAKVESNASGSAEHEDVGGGSAILYSSGQEAEPKPDKGLEGSSLDVSHGRCPSQESRWGKVVCFQLHGRDQEELCKDGERETVFQIPLRPFPVPQ